MDRFKYTTVGHRGRNHCNPIGPAKLTTVLARLPLRPGDRALDVGAGKCALLIDLCARYGCIGTAIEINPAFIAEAIAAARTSGVADRLTIVDADAETAVRAYGQDFDLGICIGSTHALGDLTATLAELKRLVKPGGFALVGELYWRQPPSEEYLEAFGAAATDYNDLAGNARACASVGFTPLLTVVANEDEFDDYEWSGVLATEEHCRTNAGDPDCAELLARRRAWSDLYLRWGRATLGFSLHLLQA